ncbi:IclR family transcriptional regulator [Saccharopolyspora phatthalungensis]|uniref:DNA-binding IclR family transcriptional regulator n=1 Tax=Saccharopolyspora phatthalungensis TaxID=664693 RepID=A0A840Q9U7_9PSEU|nr:IclR family transcriptional regulator [Saccharopolyspora phatthalungensis]MBB5157206.1 DNA-binding IclR family transcriptional regulator [Saccharopolyspora phatthalungensis]
MSGSDKLASSYRERNSTADRALDILGMFKEDLPVISGTEVAARLGVAKSTAYRYVQSLVGTRFLEEAPGGGFRLGLRVIELARLARQTYGLSDVAAPVLAELARSVGETALLTRRVGDLVVCLDRAESDKHRVRISYERGSTLPINAGASALVLLAWSPAEEAEAVLRGTTLRRFTEATLTDVSQLLARLEQIRTDGYSITRSEVDHDVLGIAAPIRGAAGNVVAAVSVAAVANRVSDSVESEIIKRVCAAAETIAAGLQQIEG